jgi:hypothetical protein
MKKPVKKEAPTVEVGRFEPVMYSRAQRLADGQTLRDTVLRQSHAGWKRPAKRRDPIDILKDSNRGRLPELAPVRYGRMLASPFTFLRGSAGLMAPIYTTPTSGIWVQACGTSPAQLRPVCDPERTVFDLNDFDETPPAPWEWISSARR